MMVAMPQKGSQVALADLDKVTLVDVKTKKVVRTVPKWGGICTSDGRYGLHAPTRYIHYAILFCCRIMYQFCDIFKFELYFSWLENSLFFTFKTTPLTGLNYFIDYLTIQLAYT
jgi:hypothetical protein